MEKLNLGEVKIAAMQISLQGGRALGGSPFIWNIFLHHKILTQQNNWDNTLADSVGTWLIRGSLTNEASGKYFD